MEYFGLSIGMAIVSGIVAFIGFCIFYLDFLLLIRPFMLWYLKINKQLEEQKRTNDLLEQILMEQRSSTPPPTYSSKSSIPQTPPEDYSRYMPKH